MRYVEIEQIGSPIQRRGDQRQTLTRLVLDGLVEFFRCGRTCKDGRLTATRSGRRSVFFGGRQHRTALRRLEFT